MMSCFRRFEKLADTGSTGALIEDALLLIFLALTALWVAGL